MCWPILKCQEAFREPRERKRKKEKKKGFRRNRGRERKHSQGWNQIVGEGGICRGNCTSALRNTVDRARLTFDEIQSGKKAAQNIVYRLKKEVINFQLKAWISYFDLLKDLCNYQINFFNYSLHLYIYIFSLFPNKFFLDLILSMKN